MTRNEKLEIRVGQNIVAARQEAGMSQQALAVATGTTQHQISKYENGTQSMSLAALDRIAKALRVTPQTLLS